MGAWNVGPFDNDDALDWLSELDDADDLEPVRRAFEALGDDYLDAPTGAIALAAAEVVAAASGNRRPELPEQLEAWLASSSVNTSAADRDAAVAAVERVVGDQSELQELWALSDSNAQWEEEISGLRDRLRADATDAPDNHST